MNVWVLKEDGQKEKFDEAKVKNAVRRSGLSPKEAGHVLDELEPRLYDGITTKQIYREVFSIIDEMRPEVSHKYNLKRALKEIGPAGHEFEDFVSTLLRHLGYSTKTRQIMQGRCVTHEIDVVADKGKHKYMVECKFHHEPGIKCRIQTGLYVYARFLDLAAAGSGVTRPWLVTNTKFSRDVVTYASCMKMPLLGWRYPLKTGLENLIDSTGCYPVSVLNPGQHALRRMLDNKIVTIFDIPESARDLAHKSGIPLKKAKEIVNRAEKAR